MHQGQGLAQQVVDVDGLDIDARLARELEQVGDDRLDAIHLLARDLEVLPDLRVRAVDDLGEVVQRVHDDAEWIANLVGDACRELSDRGHLLRLDELILETFAVGDEAEVPTADVAVVPLQRSALFLDHPGRDIVELHR